MRLAQRVEETKLKTQNPGFSFKVPRQFFFYRLNLSSLLGVLRYPTRVYWMTRHTWQFLKKKSETELTASVLKKIREWESERERERERERESERVCVWERKRERERETLSTYRGIAVDKPRRYASNWRTLLYNPSTHWACTRLIDPRRTFHQQSWSIVSFVHWWPSSRGFGVDPFSSSEILIRPFAK